MKCPICNDRVQTVRHTLSACTTSLQQGRYTFRHNLVLAEFAKHIREAQGTEFSYFDLPGERNPPAWLREHDTLLRPDGYIKLHNGTEFLIELTVPWEENAENAHRRKSEKYNILLHTRRQENPDTYIIAFEIGARGFPNGSCKYINAIFNGDHILATKCRESMTQMALRGSYILWARRNEATWSEEETY